LDSAAPLPRGVSANGIAVEFSTAAPVSLYGTTWLASKVVALEYAEAFGFLAACNHPWLVVPRKPHRLSLVELRVLK
jgi:hypothetical protein